MKTRTKVAVAGVLGAGVLATGGAALAATTSSPSTTPAPSASGSASAGAHTGHGHRGGHLLGRDVLHGQWVTHDAKTNADVTHDVISGTATGVSPGSITVKAADGTTETFTVDAATKVHHKGQAKGTTSSISSITQNQSVVVLGTGTGPFVATRVLGG